MTDRATKLAAIPIHERFLLDEDTASIMCGVSRPTFHEWVKAGNIQSVKLPSADRRRLFRREDVQAFVSSLAYQTAEGG